MERSTPPTARADASPSVAVRIAAGTASPARRPPSPSYEPQRVASPGGSSGQGVILGSQRHNGFERPFSRDQAVSCIGHCVSAVCFYVGAVGLLAARADREAPRILTLVGCVCGLLYCMIARLAQDDGPLIADGGGAGRARGGHCAAGGVLVVLRIDRPGDARG